MPPHPLLNVTPQQHRLNTIATTFILIRNTANDPEDPFALNPSPPGDPHSSPVAVKVPGR